MKVDRDRREIQNKVISSLDLDPLEFKETCSAYLPRAVSSVPPEYRDFLEQQYQTLVEIVGSVGIEALLPVELQPGIDPNTINPRNLGNLLRAKFIIPLTYAVSDGRGWEMGFSYALGKPIIPLLLKGQKVNTPTIRLPFQVPIFFEDLKKGDGEKLREFFREIKDLEIYRGNCEVHDNSLIGYNFEEPHLSCLRCLASKNLEVVSVRS